ncbi:glycoside hydrolase family 6 protein [Cellulomonas sp. KRMCY2]|uniref:glycoside hydrolase family 6 protein n=1 Tax=Cellulomonas sp. KRMCY2 TaxID=1304865 RepID=UPI0004BA8B90|nr:glycoside hydrolase family 6 protein [Cellulomonas sp. KRMCY2]
MATHQSRRRWGIAALSACALLLGTASAATAANDVLDPSSDLFVDFHSSTVEAAAGLTGQAQADALLLGSFPGSSWLTQGTPTEVQAEAHEIVTAAADQGQVPTLVAYNVPFRDCAQYSAGGATSQAEYEAWIDGLAAGIGDQEAVVILEPDGLGIIPWYTTIDGGLEWCQPVEADQATAAAERFAMLNHAVDVLTALPNTAVYLDGTHTGWLSVGDVTDRLIKAGVTRADGFFLNASNYQETEKLQKYGTWVSQCIQLDQESWFERQWCGSQYYPATPTDFSTWGLTDAAYDQAYADTGLTRDPAAMAHFVIDTSRNGQGPWTAPAGVYPSPEEWCNPLDRGLGLRPTTDTGDPLIDAYLWIKVPGESDGQCLRGTAGPQDPARGMVDPPAGGWFVEQAAELIAFAVPPVTRPTCEVSYTVHGTWPRGFNTQVWLKNTGTTTIDGWQLAFAFGGGQTVDHMWSASYEQVGQVVTASNLTWNATIRPGARTTFGFIGRTDGGPNPEPLLFLRNGAACTVA